MTWIKIEFQTTRIHYICLSINTNVRFTLVTTSTDLEIIKEIHRYEDRHSSFYRVFYNNRYSTIYSAFLPRNLCLNWFILKQWILREKTKINFMRDFHWKYYFSSLSLWLCVCPFIKNRYFFCMAGTACPVGWTPYQDSCYHVSPENESWINAMVHVWLIGRFFLQRINNNKCPFECIQILPKPSLGEMGNFW